MRAHTLSSPATSFLSPRLSHISEISRAGLCEYGILPIENSTYGTVNEVYDLMKNYRFHIVRSIKLKVDHSLLVLPGTELSDIKEIFSHEQAIGQCSEFLKAHPEIKVTVCGNTAAAAKLLRESGRHDAASISSANCANLSRSSIHGCRTPTATSRALSASPKKP